MGDNTSRADPATLAYIQKLRLEGLSAREIAKKVPGKRSRNAILGLIDRHLKHVPRRDKRSEPKTDRAPRVLAPGEFSPPSPPRRFSWQEPLPLPEPAIQPMKTAASKGAYSLR